MVREQGSGFIEKVRYDTNEKTAIFEVPAHRDLDHAIVLIDFNSVSRLNLGISLKFADFMHSGNLFQKLELVHT